MNPELLAVVAELERLEKEATQGRHTFQWGNTAPYPHRVWCDHNALAQFAGLDDAALYSATRNHLPTLLSAVRAMGEELREAREALKPFADHWHGHRDGTGLGWHYFEAAAVLLAGKERAP